MDGKKDFGLNKPCIGSSSPSVIFKYSSYGRKEPPAYKPCWEPPLDMKSDVKFGPCWDYSPQSYKRYPLPPPCRGTTIPKDMFVPNFSHCKHLYTKYDFKFEQCVHQQILIVEEKFIALEQQFAQAKKLQIQMAKQMRYHSTRYRILVNGGSCTKIYPEYLSRLTEQRALCEFQKAYNVINQSNYELGEAVMSVKKALSELRARIAKLDMTLQSPFLLGEGYDLPSLGTVTEMMEALYDYFFGVAKKYKCWAQLMDPAKEFSIEDYLALLQAKCNFDVFIAAGTEHCTCKRCDNINPFEQHIPCWCQRRSFCEERMTQQPTYRCPTEIEVKVTDSERSKPSTSSTSRFEAKMEKVKEDEDIEMSFESEQETNIM